MTTERVDGDRRSVATREKCGRRVRRALSFDMDVVETPSPSETATPRAFDGRGDSTTTRGARASAEEEDGREPDAGEMSTTEDDDSQYSESSYTETTTDDSGEEEEGAPRRRRRRRARGDGGRGGVEDGVTRAARAKRRKARRERDARREGGQRQTVTSKFAVCGTVFEVDAKYAPIKPIGKGAYGVVCSAREVETNRKVAIKKIVNAFENVVDAKRTLREIKLLRHLRHENVIEIIDCVKPEGRNEFEDVYLMYDLMDTDLYQIIRSSQSLTDEHCQYFVYLSLIHI